ncbi:MAG TPA: SDR family oxidoreductase [Acidimicrobiales bacterium]|nr:SDR family oxidoreductase [Acidimicrobiales bacterium]
MLRAERPMNAPSDDVRRVALVTGASRGIGRASARALATAGLDVAIAARTLHEGDAVDETAPGGALPIPGSLDSTARLVEEAGARALPVPMDLLDRASVTGAVERVLGEWGHIDVLVNNAVHTGPGSMEPFLELDIDTVEAKLEANVVAQLVLIKSVLPGMLERGEGTIIDITSAVATSDPGAPTGRGGWGLGYAVTKGAFHRVAGILAVELADRGIFAVNVDPGYVLTERMTAAQERLGLAGRYPGAPPSVPGSVVAWLAGGIGGISPERRAELNGTTVIAQRVARTEGLHPDWRERA